MENDKPASLGSRNRKTQSRQRTKRDAVVPEPTPSELAEIEAHQKRVRDARKVPRFEKIGERGVGCNEDLPPKLTAARLSAAVGATDASSIKMLASQGANCLYLDDDLDKINAAMAMTGALRPQNELEGMLAAQMVGCHNAAMELLRRLKETERLDCLSAYGNLAAKFLRTFTAQTEALARLRGQTGHQTVRVEHVTVEAGGQAVVGAVAPGGGGNPKDGK